MKQNHPSTAVTQILGGALLQLYASMGIGWTPVFIAIFGFIVFYTGLGQLRVGLDAAGQSAVDLLKIAALIGVAAAVLDLIPLIGIIASLGYAAAFITELVAYLRLKNSRSLGETGRSGAGLLLVAMILAVVQSLLGVLPFVGGYLAAPLGCASLALVFFGWVRVQEGMSTEAG